MYCKLCGRALIPTAPMRVVCNECDKKLAKDFNRAFTDGIIVGGSVIALIGALYYFLHIPLFTIYHYLMHGVIE